MTAALAAVATLYAWLWTGGGPGARARITVDGAPVATVALDEPRRLRVSGPLGPSLIEVADGRIRVVDSPGRRKLCVRQGWLSRAGETAVCLPNRVVVSIAGRRSIDALNY